MDETPPPALLPKPPALQKPPGYKYPNAPLRPGPPRKPVLPPSMFPRKKRRSCCATCCCCFCVAFLLIVLILAIAGGLLYLWFAPKAPVFHLQSFNMPRFNVTVKQDGTYVNARTLSRVELKNPNENVGLYYGNTNVDISIRLLKQRSENDAVSLGSDRVPGFSQAKKNVTSLKVETQVKDELIEGSAASLTSGFRSKSLLVTVEVGTRVGMKIGGLKVGPVDVKVKCGGVALKDMQAGDTPKCTINLLKWINIH